VLVCLYPASHKFQFTGDGFYVDQLNYLKPNQINLIVITHQENGLPASPYSYYYYHTLDIESGPTYVLRSVNI